MKMSEIGVNRNTLNEFINRNIGELDQNIINGIFKFLPKMCNYFEEGERFIFDLCIGYNINDTSSLKLNRVFKENKEDVTEEVIAKWIKSVAIFCKKDANVYISQSTEGEIECGLWYSNVFTGIAAEKVIIENNDAIRFSYLWDNTIKAYAKNENMTINFDFVVETCDEQINRQEEIFDCAQYIDTVKRGWTGIFSSVKRTVHGTICLFVNDLWKAQNDDNFLYNDKPDMIEIEQLNINLTNEMRNSPGKYMLFVNHKDMFIEMLNYDGITIVDTNGKVLAYNAFVHSNEKNGKKDRIVGGARARAKEALLDSRKTHYKALYYQSQEGVIEFYVFNDIDAKKLSYFSPDILKKNVQKKMDFNESVKFKQGVTIEEINTVNKLNELAMDLKSAHNGFNNFYNEYEPAKKMLEFMESEGEIVINEYLHNYESILVKCISSTVDCILGNSYGYAKDAQEILRKIIEYISLKNWIKYVDNLLKYDSDILWSISCGDDRHKRWEKEVVNIICEDADSETCRKFKITKNEARTMYNSTFEE